MSIKRRSSRGFHLIHLLGLMLLTIMASAIAVDFGFYFASQNQLQTGTDASALAATDELYRSNRPDPQDRQDDARDEADDFISNNLPLLRLDSGDVTFGYIDPATKIYDPSNFETVTTNPDYAVTGGLNAVRVVLRRTNASTNGPLRTVLAHALNVHTMETGAFSVAMLDRSITSVTNGGLRPIYACQAQVDRAMADGTVENNRIRIYGDHLEVDGVSNIPGCPPPGSGNWGFADLRDCDPGAPGMSDTSDWFDNGFPGTVRSGWCYSTQSGNALTNNSVQSAIDRLIANRTVISIPIYNQYAGGGSNTNVNVSGFAGFVITSYRPNGAANQRYIEGYFTKTVCRTECTTGQPGTGSGGTMVKLRLAARS